MQWFRPEILTLGRQQEDRCLSYHETREKPGDGQGALHRHMKSNNRAANMHSLIHSHASRPQHHPASNQTSEADNKRKEPQYPAPVLDHSP